MSRLLITVATAVTTIAVFTLHAPAVAHRTAVSPFTFHRDVVPILEARCGRCHLDDSVSGVALLRYPGARNAIWPIRQALASGHMPPWFAEGAFKAPAPVTGRELNILMTWATGGAPEGRPVPREPLVPARWALGTPDLVVPMPVAFSMAGNQRDVVHDVAMPARRIAGRLIRAVDLRPGTPAMVRRAEIIARSGGREQVLGLWQPGEAAAPLEANAAFRVPVNAAVVLRMHYRRPVGPAISDRSELGVYFARAAANPITTIELGAAAGREADHRVDRPLQVVAVRAMSGPSGAWVRLVLVAPDGARQPLARLEIRPEWNRRYVFSKPVILTAGSRIETSLVPSADTLWTSLIGERPGSADHLRVVLEVVDSSN